MITHVYKLHDNVFLHGSHAPVSQQAKIDVVCLQVISIVPMQIKMCAFTLCKSVGGPMPTGQHGLFGVLLSVLQPFGTVQLCSRG